MNLDERIDEIVDPADFTTGAAIKQLIRDVLEYVKPEKVDINFANHGDSAYNYGINDAIESMEAKAKELGL
jgi:hypothetical protein